MILCLDFDGVLHSYASGWKGAREIPDPPVPGAMAFLLRAVEEFEVAIHSSRSQYFGGRRAMKEWLRHWMLEHFWETHGAAAAPESFTAQDVDDQLRPAAHSVIGRIAFPLWKPAAFITIDDRAITFEGTFPDPADLKTFRPWNKRTP